MKKILLALIATTFLAACTTEENLYVDSNWQTEIEVLPPSRIQTQPDEFIQELQTIKDVPPVNQAKASDSMELLAKKLRKGLRSSGVSVKEISGQIDLVIPNTVSFGNTQKNISPKFSESLSLIAELLKECNETMIQIIGYTDNSSPVLLGKEITLQKADVIAGFLKDHGVEAGRIITDGAGAENPVATNSTSAGREQNRRIEMTIISLK